jgi:cytochrome b6-f complex iron-sulfur subunit
MAQRLVAAFRALLAAYPAEFRAEYGEDMVQVFADQLRDRRPAQQAALFARAAADVVRSAAAERVIAPAPAVASAGPPLTLPRGRTPATNLPTRRDFLRRALGLAGATLATSVVGSSLAYLWPNVRGAFGSLVAIGTPAELSDAIRAAGGTLPVPSARSYLVAYDPADDPDGFYTEITAGAPFMALYQRCVHLGCRVPWCVASTRFECPCHKSRYNRWGEYQSGPAPRGLDRFPVRIVKGQVVVDTGTIVTGPPQSTTVLNEGPTGPSCL